MGGGYAVLGILAIQLTIENWQLIIDNLSLRRQDLKISLSIVNCQPRKVDLYETKDIF
jgi:hypothetical protein